MLRGQLREYLAHLSIERGLSKHTIAAYTRDLDRYCTFLEAQGYTKLSDVVEGAVREYAQVISEGSDGAKILAASSASRAIVAVRGWHRFDAAESLSSVNAAEAVKPRAVPKRLPKALAVDDMLRIIDSAGVGEGPTQLRDRALVELLYASGARISEIINLDVDDLTVEDGLASLVLHGKGDKYRVVPIGHVAVKAVDAYLVRARRALVLRGKGTSALFVNMRGTRLTRQGAWGVLREAAERAGVEGVSPHTVRHSFATHLLQGGADVRVVQELLGHSSVTTTQIYTKVTQDALLEVYRSSHPRA